MIETLSETLNRIIASVCAAFEVAPEDFWSDNRSIPVANSRQVVAWIAVELEGIQKSAVAKHIKRDNATVICGLKSIHRKRDHDLWFRRMTDALYVQASEAHQPRAAE